MKDSLIVWVAQGFGTGRAPKAPGTVGSLLGLVWLMLLQWIPDPWVVLGLILGSLGLGVWLCTEAERILDAHDPGSIVIDEIVAIPVAGMVWLWRGQGADAGSIAAWLVVVFVLFRIFDIAKPWPVGAVQHWPRGWGVMADDILAGVYVALITGGLVWLGVLA